MACFAHLTTLEAVAIDLQMACQTIGPCALVRHAEDSSLAATDTHTGGGCITTRGCDLGTLLRCSLSLSLTVAVRSIALQPKSALLWILACNSHGRLEIDYHLQDVIEISAWTRFQSGTTALLAIEHRRTRGAAVRWTIVVRGRRQRRRRQLLLPLVEAPSCAGACSAAGLPGSLVRGEDAMP